MKETFYDIHGLISISAKGTSSLIDSLDSHLSLFKSDASFEKVSIKILPFSDFKGNKNGQALDDWIFSENFAIRESRNLAFNLVGESVILYADRLEIPINLLMQIALLKVDCTFVHSAGIQMGKSGVLFPAPPGVGKTTTVSMLVKNGNFLLGDDLCILSAGKIWSYPQSLSVYPYHRNVLPRLKFKYQVKLSAIALKESLILKVLNGASFFSRGLRFAISLLLPNCLSIDPAEVFGNDAVINCSPLSAVVFIQRSHLTDNLSLVQADEDAIASAAKILWHEWHGNFHELLLLDALMYGPHWLESLILQTESIIYEVIKNVPVSKITIPAMWLAEDLAVNEMDLLGSIDLALKGALPQK